MDAKTLTIELTRSESESLFRSARAMPADKLVWTPEDKGRSALKQLQECALCPKWAVELLEARKWEWKEGDQEAAAAEKAALTTVDACEKEFAKNFAAYIAVVKAFPEADLTQTIEMPFGKKIFPLFEIMTYPLWNLSYHSGQLGYIQTMYGDNEMY